jgi:hypothetical protein
MENELIRDILWFQPVIIPPDKPVESIDKKSHPPKIFSTLTLKDPLTPLSLEEKKTLDYSYRLTSLGTIFRLGPQPHTFKEKDLHCGTTEGAWPTIRAPVINFCLPWLISFIMHS